MNRREMPTRCSTGFGMLALQGLMSNRASADAVGGRKPRPAKHVILCYMSGGVSQVDRSTRNRSCANCTANRCR